MASHDGILRYVSEQLDSICSRTEMWGPNLCVELQYLLLIEFWLVTARPDLERENPRFVLDEYQAFCRRNGFAPNIPLADTTDQDEFQRLIQSFRSEVLQKLKPKNPFEEHDLTVAYNLIDGKPLSESLVSNGLSNVRRVLRAVVRPTKKRSAGGRSRKDIEALTDFEILDVDVRPRNGVAARVVIPMRQQQPVQYDWSAQQELRDALSSVVEMAEWASAESTMPAPIRDPAQRDWIAWQTIRLVPGGDVESMELGGKLVARPTPVKLTISQRPRLLSALGASLKEEPFQQTGSIRAVNRDTLVLKFRPDYAGSNLECWLLSAEDLRLVEQNLCSKLLIHGRLLTHAVRRPLVLVDSVMVVDGPAEDEDDD